MKQKNKCTCKTNCFENSDIIEAFQVFSLMLRNARSKNNSNTFLYLKAASQFAYILKNYWDFENIEHVLSEIMLDMLDPINKNDQESFIKVNKELIIELSKNAIIKD